MAVSRDDGYREAHRTYKLVKCGVKDAHNLTPEEFGLLYLHFPGVLPDIDEGERP